ncbi:hypothetical protein LUZ60_011279 [Juncus effusus]|nr:hypothetical protein LUZ60_011279 [Juncus effusus]
MALAMAEKTITLEPQIHLKKKFLLYQTPISTVLPKFHTKTQKDLNSKQPTKPPDPKFKQKPPSPPLLRPKPQSKPKSLENNRNSNTHFSSLSSNSNNSPGDVLKLMDLLQFRLSEEMYLDLIKECTDTRDAIQGAIVHTHVMKSYKNRHSLVLLNRLILMYASCGEIKSARKLFDEMPFRDTLSWATIIAAYSEYSNGHYHALKLFVKMHFELREGQYYSHAIVVALRSCAQSENLQLGLQIHSLMIKKLGLKDSVSGNRGSSLLQFYSSFGLHETAHQVFHKMTAHFPNEIQGSAWSAIITVSNRQNRFKESLNLFVKMVKSGKKRTTHSLSPTLTACAEIDATGLLGKQIHADAVKNGFGSEKFVVSGLVCMYMKKGLVRDAVRCFQGIDFPDLVSWNSVLVGYTRNGFLDEAIKVLYEMRAKGIEPSDEMIKEVQMSIILN